MSEENYISAYEYEKNVNPDLKYSPFCEMNITECKYGINFVDFSDIFNVSHKSSSPNLLASFIKLDTIDNVIELCNTNIEYNSTSNLFYIIEGTSSITIDDKEEIVNTGDILISPCFNTIKIQNIGEKDLQIYYVNDSPLLNYLGSKAEKKIFKTAVYSNQFLIEHLNSLSDPNNNRKGILLSNKDTEVLGVNTITPVLWALYNELPPNTHQKPHRHNSVALDFCIKCDDSENVYTLIGEELDNNGDIINPSKIHWKTGSMFITPPTLWHSHNNSGDTHAYIIPIQDAGLLLYQRVLGIVLTK